MKYFIYFSATGNGDYIASLLEEKGYQLVKVEMAKPIKKVGFGFILRYGGEASINKKAKIKDLSFELKEDDEVTIGTPLWNDRLSTPINTVLANYNFNKETTKFIFYLGGSSAKAAKKRLIKLGFKQEPLVIYQPLKNQEETKKLLEKE